MIYVDSSITRHVILQINLFLNPSEMSVWQYRILITFYMMVLQCSQWLRRQNILIYAMLAIIMNLGFMMSYISWEYIISENISSVVPSWFFIYKIDY